MKRTIKNATEIEKAIISYFPTECNVEVVLCGNIADAIITYTDFKPMPMVQNELSLQFPYLRISEIHRVYSDSAMEKILRQFIEEDTQVFLPYEDGSLRPINIGEIIEERLFDKVIG